MKDCVYLNSARNCLKYAIKAFEIKEIHLPYYTCPVVWQAVKKEGCKIHFYRINKNFMPVQEFNQNDFIVYTNYFGICAKNVKTLSVKYKNLIVDNAQAFYIPKYGIASFNSLRKFFDVPDGAILHTDKLIKTELSQDTTSKIFDKSNEKAFCENENRLNTAPSRRISELSKTLFEKSNTEAAKQKRLENFYKLAQALDRTNLLKVTLDKDDVPFVYPYLNKDTTLRQHLEKSNIFVEQFWNPMKEGSIEAEFQKYLLPLPVHQNTNGEKILRIIKVLKN